MKAQTLQWQHKFLNWQIKATSFSENKMSPDEKPTFIFYAVKHMWI
jgi:hypothetical protein